MSGRVGRVPGSGLPACARTMATKRCVSPAADKGTEEAKRFRSAIDGVADGFVCPITYELPLDPVMAEDGFIYERSAIEEWLRRQQRSPSTNEPMGTRLVASARVQNTIKALVQSGAISGDKADQWKRRLEDEERAKTRLVALVGKTPDGVRASKLGLFVKRVELVNEYPSYIRAGDDSTMMWHAGAFWHVGKSAEVGQARGFVRVPDGALSPDAVQSQWQVRYSVENTWVAAPGVRCLGGGALSAELATASPRVALVGPTPDGLQAGGLGVFVKRDELVNEYPSYVKAGDDTVMMWHAGSCWDVGSSANVGQTRGFVNVPDGALSPDAVQSQWQVLNGAEDTWVAAPGVRCLGGGALSAELAKASPRVALVGPTPDGLQADRLGVFVKRDELVNEYPSYVKAGEGTVMMWHAGRCWWVGDSEDIGQDQGYMSVEDGALSPDAALGVRQAGWEVASSNDEPDEWLAAPGVRCLGGGALSAELAKASPRVALLGPTPDGLQADRLGVFVKRDELVNEYPSYVKAGEGTVMMWHAGRCWWVGDSEDIGQDQGYMSVKDGALSPDAALGVKKAGWQVASSDDDEPDEWLAAPGVRCLGQPAGEPQYKIWDVENERWVSTFWVFE